jgi:transposase
MARPSTEIRDQRIVKLYKNGKEPKRIAQSFNVTVWVVYMAIRRLSGQQKGQSPIAEPK